MNIKQILFSCCLILFVVQATPLQAAPSAGIAAIINGEIISNLELDKNIRNTLKSRGIDQSNHEYEAFAREAREKLLQSMIDEKLFLMEAKNQSISVTDAEIEREVQTQISKADRSSEEFYNELGISGISKEDYYNKIESNLITQKLVRINILRKIFVGDEEILEYYQTNNMHMDSMVQLAVIVYPSINDALTYGEILKNNPERFAEITKNISIGPNASLGGKLDDSLLSALSEPVRFQINKMKNGDVSNLFSLGDKEAQIKLINKEVVDGGAEPIIDEETRRQIESNITEEKAKVLITEYLDRLKSKAIITIK